MAIVVASGLLFVWCLPLLRDPDLLSPRMVGTSSPELTEHIMNKPRAEVSETAETLGGTYSATGFHRFHPLQQVIEE